MNSPRVRFFTRKGCTLCDEIFPSLQSLCAQYNIALETIDIDSDTDLLTKHGNWVPVVEIDGRVHARGIIQPAHLKRELAIASKLGPAELSKLRIAVAIIFDDEGRMLVNKRPDDSYFGGWWEWPGGKCELGESPMDAAQRELKEEIGVEAEVWVPYRRQRSEYPGRIVNLHFFTAKLKAGSQAHHYALEHQWLAPKHVAKLRFLEANQEVLASLSGV